VTLPLIPRLLLSLPVFGDSNKGLDQIVKLLLRFIPYLTGYVLFQIDPKYAYDTDKIVATVESKILSKQL